MDLEAVQALRKEAAHLDDPKAWHKPETKIFQFDLNQGWMNIVDPTPERVMELVTLARKHAANDRYGEHNALLQLVTAREELEKNAVFWRRPYHVGTDCDLSLRQWLEENGQNPSSVFTEQS